jgi:hypothetical protein
MNCFRHPVVTAIAFCRHCDKPLCRECCQTKIQGQGRVCSEECARFAALRPQPVERGDTPFQRVYAAAFLVVLLATLGGGLCLWIAQSEIARADSDARKEARGESVPYGESANSIRIFYLLGIRDWKLQFGIGAAIGAGIAMLWIRRSNKGQRKEHDNAAAG